VILLRISITSGAFSGLSKLTVSLLGINSARWKIAARVHPSFAMSINAQR
jgi:hypothetical protein